MSWKKRFTLQSLIGAGLIFSTPISGIISFALGAVALGETRLENTDGVTGLGLLFILLPAVVGTVLILADVLGGEHSLIALVKMRPFAAAVITTLIGVSGLSLALFSLLTAANSADPNIGAGLLILASGLLTTVGLVGCWFARQGRDITES